MWLLKHLFLSVPAIKYLQNLSVYKPPKFYHKTLQSGTLFLFFLRFFDIPIKLIFLPTFSSDNSLFKGRFWGLLKPSFCCDGSPSFLTSCSVVSSVGSTIGMDSWLLFDGFFEVFLLLPLGFSISKHSIISERRFSSVGSLLGICDSTLSEWINTVCWCKSGGESGLVVWLFETGTTKTSYFNWLI